MKHDPVSPGEIMITMNKDIWPLMGKIKEYPSVKEESIDADSDANGHNGTNLVINGLNRLKGKHVTPM